jgi:uncharacterized protein YkwD
MWQSFHTRRPQRTIRRRTHLGLLACLVSVLLIGVVIGRATYRVEEPDKLYLDNAPSHPAGKVGAASDPSASPTPHTSQPGASRLDASRAGLESMVPVAKSPEPRRTQPAPRADDGPRRRPSNTIEGSSGGGPASLITPGGQDGGDRRTSLGAIENAVVRLVNLERRRAGCVPLYVDQRLVRSAREHSAEMASLNRLTHNSPNGDSPWERMEAAGYPHGGAENIARGYHTAEEAVRGWMAHRDHRANILNCRLTATGVGVRPGPGGPWWTQDFGYS